MSALNHEARQSSLRRDLGLVGWQIRYEQRAYWRNRGRGVFTFVFPIMFLVIFASLNKGAHISSRGGISYDAFFVPGILAYGVIAATFVNMAIGTAILRDQGVLKRMQGTPLPPWAYVAARIGSTVIIVLAMTAVTVGLGAVAYGVHLRGSTLPGLIVTLVLGTAAFTALGIGITRFIPNAEAAPVVVAKGAGVIAQRIRRLALENNIPIVERKELARVLYKEVDVNRPIPLAQYAAVAEILRYVYRLKGKPLPKAA